MPITPLSRSTCTSWSSTLLTRASGVMPHPSAVWAMWAMVSRVKIACWPSMKMKSWPGDFAMRAISPERARRTFMPSATRPAFIISFSGFVRIGASAMGSSWSEECTAIGRRVDRSVRHHRALAGPGAEGVDLLAARHRERPGRLQLVEEDLGAELGRARERGVEPGDDGLLDLGAGEAVGARDQPIEVEGRRVALPLAQVHGEDLPAILGGRQVHEEDLVEPALAGELGRQLRDVVRGRDHEDGRRPVLEPAEEAAEDSLGQAGVRVARGRIAEGFLELVDHEHTGRHVLGRPQGLLEVLLRFADEFVL